MGVEAQPQSRDRDGSVPVRGKGDRWVGKGGKGKRPGHFMKKFFSDSCRPDCGEDEKGFSVLVASNAECITNFGNRTALKAFKKDVAVRPKNFCDAENTRVCTYCVEFNAWPPTLVSNEVCEMTKPETCEKPTDLKEADCVCDATRSDE